MQIGIIGAGMAGLACGKRLSSHGHRVRLFDKGLGAGGRMSTRRIETGLGRAYFDYGAQYFTAHDAGFADQVAAWEAAGLAGRYEAAGDDVWVGTPGRTRRSRTSPRAWTSASASASTRSSATIPGT